MTVELKKTEHRIVGAWQQPVNRWQGVAENSIHTDAVARRVGMRGGTIPGTVHLTHFRPILTELFGPRWLKTGSISMFYTFATTDREDVRAVVEEPADRESAVQMAAWVEDKEGRTVCKGSVSVGDLKGVVSYIRSLPLENAPEGAPRILAQMKPGMAIPPVENYLVKDGGEEGELRDPQLIYRSLAVFPPGVVTQPAVGFFGATEIRLHNGPIKVGVPYRKSGSVACVGQSPKTEFAWFDSALHDADGHLIADMRHMTRWMKVSSPLWANG
jgi:hypothetical protein